MKNLIRQNADNLTCIAPYALASGEMFMVGAFFMVASSAAASGASVVGVTKGEFAGVKATGEVWAFGDKLYWDATNKRLTKTASGNTHVCVATGAAISAATAGPVKLRIAA